MVDQTGGSDALTIPLNAAFGNPDLLESVGIGPVLQSLGAEREYKNDEQIDNSLRSVLFQVPKPGIPDPTVCGSPAVNPDCFSGVQDLGAIDIERGRDHGMPSYNALRRAYGLRPKRSFTDITGESTDRFPNDPEINPSNPSNPIDDPSILDFTELKDANGNSVALGSDQAQEDAVVGIRRTTLAARLKAIYGDVDRSTHSLAWSPSVTSEGRSSVSCSSRCGQISSRRFATATGSSIGPTRFCG